MDTKLLRKKNEAVINALARVERADLNLRLARQSLDEARKELAVVFVPTTAVLTSPMVTLTTEEKAMIDDNSVIYAIRSVRARTDGLGLKEAKDIVDEYRFRSVR